MTEQSSTPKVYVESVRGQYEILPYPPRDYSNERAHLYTCDNVSLDSINHDGWGGKRDLRTKGTRFLVAGQGTGDTTLFLAEQLRGTDAEIVSIDLSSASIAICKNRLAERGLTNVMLHHMSILDLPTAGLGQFDFIESSGVLHHLEDPSEGLKALGTMLKDDGIMAIMVYALYGRLAIYATQALMQYLIAPDTHPMVKIDIARAFLKELPCTHPMTHAHDWSKLDIEEESGGGIYDLLLHSTDRAYTVPQIYEWIEGVGLAMGNFCGEWEGEMGYVPEVYTRSALLRALVAEKPIEERQTIAELMSGTIMKHVFYVSKARKVAAEFADDMVITLGFRQRVFSDFAASLITALTPLSVGAQFEQPVQIIKAPSLVITKQPHTLALLARLGSERTIGDIVAEVAQESGAPADEVREHFRQLYHELNSRRRVFLRHKDVPPYIQWLDIVERLKSIPPIKTAA
jgi:2-polyprenyl-3-methyl-5-hydroxy-6-metoxy-1,4-benzoquinol methylase